MPYRTQKGKLSATQLQVASKKRKQEQLQAETDALEQAFIALKSTSRPKLPTVQIEDDDDDYDSDTIVVKPSRATRHGKKTATKSFVDLISLPSDGGDSSEEEIPVKPFKTTQNDNTNRQLREISPSELAKDKLDRSLSIISKFKAARKKEGLHPINKKEHSPTKLVPRKRGRPPKNTKSVTQILSSQETDIMSSSQEILERRVAVRQLVQETEEELEKTILKAQQLEENLSFLMDEEERINGLEKEKSPIRIYMSPEARLERKHHLSSEPLAVCTPTKLGLLEESESSPDTQRNTDSDSDIESQHVSKKRIVEPMSPSIQPATEERKSFMGPINLASRSRRVDRLNHPKADAVMAGAANNKKQKQKHQHISPNNSLEIGRLNHVENAVEDDYGFGLEGNVDMGHGATNSRVITKPKPSLLPKTGTKPVVTNGDQLPKVSNAIGKNLRSDTVKRQTNGPELVKKKEPLNIKVNVKPTRGSPEPSTAPKSGVETGRITKPKFTKAAASKPKVTAKVGTKPAKPTASSPDSLASAIKPPPKPAKGKAVFMGKNRKYDEQKLKEMSDTIDDLEKYFGIGETSSKSGVKGKK